MDNVRKRELYSVSEYWQVNISDLNALVLTLSNDDYEPAGIRLERDACIAAPAGFTLDIDDIFAI